jgi:serine/threonine protein kinase
VVGSLIPVACRVAVDVLQAIDRQSNSQVALKVYHTGRLHELNRYQVLREVYLHAHLQHVNIIQMYAAFQVRWRGSVAFAFALFGSVAQAC